MLIEILQPQAKIREGTNSLLKKFTSGFNFVFECFVWCDALLSARWTCPHNTGVTRLTHNSHLIYQLIGTTVNGNFGP